MVQSDFPTTTSELVFAEILFLYIILQVRFSLLSHASNKKPLKQSFEGHRMPIHIAIATSRYETILANKTSG